ncbi:MAG: Asp-tRNA(Asn)/Glu-tRNA(Gln) amidotransferase subunit GatC [Patescibacteria group bacterium]
MDINLDHVAKLAKLKLTEVEKEALGRQLPAIVEYVAKLQEVDTTNIDPKAYLTEATNVFRADEQTTTQSERDAAVAAFPKSTGDALEVPGIFH